MAHHYDPLSSKETAIHFTQAIPVGTYAMRVDLDGVAKFSFVSDRFVKMFDLEREKVLGDIFYAFSRVHPEEYEEFVALNMMVFDQVLPFYWEGRVLVKGEVRWIIAESIPTRLESGVVVWEGACTDITRQKTAELALQAKHLDTTALLENAPMPLFLYTLGEQRVIFQNKAFINLFGYTLDDIPTLGEFALLAIPDKENRNLILNSWNDAIVEYSRHLVDCTRVEVELRSKSGKDLSVMVSATIFNSNVIVSLLDQTDLKRTERLLATIQSESIELAKQKAEYAEERLDQTSNELVKSEQQLRFVLDVTGDGIWDWNIETGEIKHNTRWIEMLKESPSQNYFSLDDFIARIHPDDLSLVHETLDAALFSLKEYHVRYRMIRLDGQVIWVEDKGAIVERSSEGKPLRMVGAISDISDEIQAQNKVQELIFYDSLTKLPNRNYIHNRMQILLETAAQSKTYAGLKYLDLDNFKNLTSSPP